uniref:Uncharacterized protein n=1 Tax=Trieres chinensis TaxID=1514140 RepID=A0A7S1Z632_TRICV
MRAVLLLVPLSTARAFRAAAPAATASRRRPPSRPLAASSSSGPSSSSDADVSDRFWTARDKCWRPDVPDVERISWGKPAKKKGTGSRGVPHRLNRDERDAFDRARAKGFLEIGGSGWRSQRRDAPLMNTYRSLCDARGQPTIVLHKGNTGMDEVVVDLSPLRLPDDFADVARSCAEFVDMPSALSDETPWEDDDGDVDEDEDEGLDESEDPWESRPIYQLPPYYVAWELPRSNAKEIGKKLAGVFGTIEKKAPKSKKPNHVRPGKNRRSGGYGIG